MTLEQHSEDMRLLVQQLAESQSQDALETTLDAIGLLKLRLASGENKDGSAFSDYSTLYAEKRQDKGLQTAHKDFNVTGQLYASILPEIEAQEFGKVTVSIVPRGSDNQNKVRGQVKRDGIIIEPSQSEVQEITAIYSRRRTDRIKQLLKI